MLRWRRFKRLLSTMALRCCEHISLGFTSHCSPLLHLGEDRALGVFKLKLIQGRKVVEYSLVADSAGDVIIPKTLLANTIYYFELSTTLGVLVACHKFETYYKS